MLVRRPRPWDLPEATLAPEATWRSRREIVAALGLGAIGAALPGCAAEAGRKKGGAPTGPVPDSYAWELPRFDRSSRYPLDRELTEEAVAASHNNFYEFSTDKGAVWRLAHTLQVRPWTVEVTGEVHRPRTFDLETLLRTMPIEERTYRFRCVEAWSMAVPWVGFPLAALLAQVEPTTDAAFVRFVTIDAPRMFPGVRSQPWYSWPYREGLTIREALHPLTLLAVGIYGHPLPNQHGAPIRLVVPWKYGYKNIKSIARIEVVRSRPRTLWNDAVPSEYDFAGNVRPDIPHPRWSQATERLIPSGRRVPTLLYNGYDEQVADLYG